MLHINLDTPKPAGFGKNSGRYAPEIDDALKVMGHKDGPQTKVPTSAILTLAILAALELGGKHNKALALAQGAPSLQPHPLT